MVLNIVTVDHKGLIILHFLLLPGLESEMVGDVGLCI